MIFKPVKFLEVLKPREDFSLKNLVLVYQGQWQKEIADQEGLSKALHFFNLLIEQVQAIRLNIY